MLGGGIAGFTSALALRERGCDVTIVESHEPGGGATAASAGMVAPLYESRTPTPVVRLGVESRRAWPDFAASLERRSGRSLGWRSGGMLVRNETSAEHEAASEAASWQREEGLASEIVTARRARRLEPGLGPGAVSYLWLEREAHLDPHSLCEALVLAARKAGVRLVSGTGDAALDSRAGRVTGIRTKAGASLAADAVVVACGAWSGHVDGLPRPLPVRPVRGQMLALRPAGRSPSVIVADHSGRYAVPRRPGLVVVGSTMEEAGFAVQVTESGASSIRDAVGRLVPALERAPEIQRWAGLRPGTPDDLPVIGPDPELEGLYYATGYGRRGILLAPLVARTLADWILGREPAAAWRAFLPGRFAESPDARA